MMNVFFREQIWRTVVIYFTALFLVRLMGKRALGEMSLFDFVIMAGIGDIIVEIGINKKTSFFSGLMILIVFVLLEKGVSWLTSRSRRWGKLIEGSPAVIILNGKIIEENLRREHLSKADIAQEMRKEGLDDISRIKVAVFEPSGKISFILYPGARPLDKNDLYNMEALFAEVSGLHDSVHRLLHTIKKGHGKIED